MRAHVRAAEPFERHERQPESTVVGAILTQRQMSVQMHVWHGAELLILVRDALGALLKLLTVLLGPPIVQIAVTIELTSLVVEAVRQFVANHSADGAEIHGVVARSAVERRLQDPGREVDIVFERIVICIDGWGRHAPLRAVNRFTDFV